MGFLGDTLMWPLEASIALAPGGSSSGVASVLGGLAVSYYALGGLPPLEIVPLAKWYLVTGATQTVLMEVTGSF